MLVRVSVLQEKVETKDYETESVSDSEVEWMGEQETDCF